MPPGTPTDTPVAQHRPTRHGPGVATDASEPLARRDFPASSARSRVASPASHVLIVTEDGLLIDGKNGKATRATSETGTPPLGGPASPHDALSSHPATSFFSPCHLEVHTWGGLGNHVLKMTAPPDRKGTPKSSFTEKSSLLTENIGLGLYVNRKSPFTATCTEAWQSSFAAALLPLMNAAIARCR